MNVFFAWYSETAARYCDSYIYKKEDGSEVKCTAVFKDMMYAHKMYKWADKKFVGKVVEFVRRNRKPIEDQQWT